MVEKTWFGIDNTVIDLPLIAKFDKSAVLVRGLFRSLYSRAERPMERIEFSRTFEDGDVAVTFSCRALLGVPELRVLQGLVALATDRYRAVAADRRYARARDASGETNLRVKCSLRQLATVAGVGSPGAGPTNDAIRASLAKLCDVTVAWRSIALPSQSPKEAFLSNAGSGVGHGGVDVVFHSALQGAILASRGGDHYLKVRMDEARRLRGDCARLLHHRLSHMNEGERTPHGFDTLQSYIWGRSPSRSADAHRRDALVDAICEIEDLEVGWKFEKGENPGIVYITRPKSLVQKFEGLGADDSKV